MIHIWREILVFIQSFSFAQKWKENFCLKEHDNRQKIRKIREEKNEKKVRKKCIEDREKLSRAQCFFSIAFLPIWLFPFVTMEREKKLSQHEWNAFDVKAYSSYQSQSHHCVKWISLKKVKVEFPFNATQESTNNNISLRFERSNCQSINKQTIALLRLIQCKQLALFVTIGGFVT